MPLWEISTYLPLEGLNCNIYWIPTGQWHQFVLQLGIASLLGTKLVSQYSKISSAYRISRLHSLTAIMGCWDSQIAESRKNKSKDDSMKSNSTPTLHNYIMTKKDVTCLWFHPILFSYFLLYCQLDGTMSYTCMYWQLPTSADSA